MTPTATQIHQDLAKLLTEGSALITEERANQRNPAGDTKDAARRYQRWYTLALAVIKRLAPDRYQDFRECYEAQGKGQVLIGDYTIQNFLQGDWALDPMTGTTGRQEYSKYILLLDMQVGILESANDMLVSILADVSGVLQAQLFDDELSAAQHLLHNGYNRAAGAIGGVVLEGHLKSVVSNHSLHLAKTNPTINDLNQILKDNMIIDTPTWRFIQRLGDIRNLCDHKNAQEPSPADVQELLDGVDRIIKSVF